MFDALIIIIDIAFFIFYIFMSHWRATTDYGPEVARQLLPRNLMIALVATLFVTLSTPGGRPFTVFLFASITLALWLTWLAHLLRKSDESQILLCWKQTRPNVEVVAIVFFLVAGIAATIYGLTRQPAQMYFVYMGSFFSACSPIFYFQKEARLTEKGIETGRDYIRWEQIESYRWSKSEKSVTQVFFKTSRRLPAIILVQLDLPLEKKQAVKEIMLQKVQHIPVLPEETSQQMRSSAD